VAKELTSLNLDPWWDEPAYRAAMSTFSERGAFILGKLKEHDAEKLDTVLSDLYRAGTPDPTDITKFEWSVILSYFGASEGEIADVQKRMGRVWR
jgi:hypothetical protein